MKTTLYNFITKKQRGFVPTLFRLLLLPCCWLYSIVVHIRNFCFDIGFFKQKRLPCTVISIGNISVGGTGKTPTVTTIANLLYNSGSKVSVLLRGYKRQNREKIVIVTDGKELLCSREESGDEAHMLAHQLTGIPIIVGKYRHLSGETAISRYHSDVLILDDGFQHRQLERDINILTIDVTRPFGTGALLPIGTLREPKSSINRADIIILTRTDAAENNITELKTVLNQLTPNTPIVESIHKPTSLYWLNSTDNERTLPLHKLTGKRLLAVCGIGNPDALVSTLDKYSPESIELLAFPDHHVYSEHDIQQIKHQMGLCGAEWIITTQKDEQKLTSLNTDLPILVLAIELVITQGEKDLLDMLPIYK